MPKDIATERLLREQCRSVRFGGGDAGKSSVMFEEVEKRWHHLDSLGAAVLYVVVVITLATVAFTAYALGDRHDLAWAFATPGVLLVGAIGAFVKTHRDWRARRAWAIWQGAGWFLLVTTLLSFGIPSMGVLG